MQVNRILLIIFIQLISLSVKALDYGSFLIYKEIGTQEGLSQNRVNSIFKSSDGYLWLGTDYGLNRYDGNMMKTYFYDRENISSLPSNKINFIVEDAHSNLWIGTDRGLCVYDRFCDCFNRRNELVSQSAFSYLMLDDGILLGIGQKLFFYDYSSGKISFLINIFAKTMVNYKGHIYINTRYSGIYEFDRKDNRLIPLTQFKGKNYTSLYVDSHNRLWLASYGKGVYCYENGSLVKYLSTENSSLNNNIILDFAEKDNHLLLATDGGGINIVSLMDFSTINVERKVDNPNSLPESSFCSIYCDPDGNVFAGSVRHGVYLLKLVNAYTYNKTVPFGNKYGLSYNTVLSFCQSDNGVALVGTDGGGINIFNSYNRLFFHMPETVNERITSIIEYSDDLFLYYGYNKGFRLIDKSGRVKSFDVVNKKLNDIVFKHGLRVKMFRCGNDIFISSYGIFIYNIENKILKKIAEVGNGIRYYNPIIVGEYAGNVYFTDGPDIFRYNYKTEIFSKIYSGIDLIKDAVIDENGIIWYGTGGGLWMYDANKLAVEKINNSLLDEITSIMYDNKRRLYIGTRRELFIYLIDENRLILTNEDDGIAINEYISKSYCKLPSGDILLGGISGMTYIKSGFDFELEQDISISLLDFLVDGKHIKSREQGKIRLFDIPWNFNYLDIILKSGLKNIFHGNHYRFRIGNTDEKYLYSHSNSIKINYLPEGKYDVFVSYYKKSGDWSDETLLCKLQVFPPWWRSSLFFILLFILFVLILFFIMYIFYIKKKREHRREINRLKKNMYNEKIDFLINLSHELRTPLTLICSPLKRILNHQLPEDSIEQNLSIAYQQAYRMRDIINMVLDIRKLEEGKSMLYIMPHKFNEWIKLSVHRFEAEMEARHINLVLVFDKRIKEVSFDDNKCDFVLSNFLSNSIKFSNDDTEIIVQTSLSDDLQWVRVSVKDEGIGLSNVDLNSVFNNFYQGEHERGGSGVGLAYSKKIIDWHKGRIGAVDNDGKGAVFYFELPLSLTNNSDNKSFETSLEIENNRLNINESYSFANSAVLIAEDDSDLRNYLKETFKKIFAKVYVASNGLEALEKARERFPDVIISDVMMPKMNGFDFCKEVKSDIEISHIPFILLTAHNYSQNMYTGYKLGADLFIPKPFEIDDLLILISNLLQKREAVRKRYEKESFISVKDVSFSNADEMFLSNLDDYISKHLDDSDLNVEALASNMYISRSLLFKKIKALTGMGVVDYLNNKRIRKAEILLLSTEMSITEISEIVGFSSLKYFGKVFKKINGISPLDYRKGAKS